MDSAPFRRLPWYFPSHVDEQGDQEEPRKLLLLVDSDKRAGMMRGDLGRVVFSIRDDDLEARDFGRVVAHLQC